MSLNVYRDEAGEFLNIIASHDSETTSKILEMIDKEYALLKDSIDLPDTVGHQIYDILFLLFELASKYNIDLNTEWIKGRKKKLKYIKK